MARAPFFELPVARGVYWKFGTNDPAGFLAAPGWHPEVNELDDAGTVRECRRARRRGCFISPESAPAENITSRQQHVAAPSAIAIRWPGSPRNGAQPPLT